MEVCGVWRVEGRSWDEVEGRGGKCEEEVGEGGEGGENIGRVKGVGVKR